jgi:hypothetical protein
MSTASPGDVLGNIETGVMEFLCHAAICSHNVDTLLESR